MLTVTPQPADLDRVRFIAADMDHTLLDEDGKLPELPDGVYNRVLALQDLGVRFAIASGRPLMTLKALFPRLMPKIMLIGDNGGIICDCGEVIYQGELPVADYQRMIALTHERGDIGMICTAESIYIEGAYRHYDEVFREFYYHITYVEDLTELSPLADKYTVYLPEGDSVERLADTYGPAFGEEFDVVSSGPVWLDFSPKGMNKGGAMRQVSELLGISTDEMMAFGDAFNDAQMLKTVGFGYAMANALPGVEKFARYVAPSNADHGVLKVIDQVIEAKRQATR